MSAASISLLDLHPPASDFRQEVLDGLRRHPRRLSSMYFYDAEGSRLFDRICGLDEYYPTRTERAILCEYGDEIAAAVGERALLIEFGSGSSEKTRLLLDRLLDPVGYVPVDISREHLLEAAKAVARRYPRLEVLPVCADFTRPFPTPRTKREPQRRVVFFPGSTLGNFDPENAQTLLEVARDDAGPGGGVLLGLDLVKDEEILRRAYDDDAGVTAAFNLNLLRRINRELGADFDLEAFAHEVRYDRRRQRIEMHLRSLRRQTVRIGEERFEFEEGETIHTENSHKYELTTFESLAAKAGLRLDRSWTDRRGWFAVVRLRVGGA